MKTRWILTMMVALLAVSCGREFDPYWRIIDFRLLGVRSSEPELRPGETAVFDALTFSPDGSPVTYQWEWCPFRTQAAQEYKCPLTKDELDQLIREQGNLPDGFTLPIPDFDMGTNPTASLPYPAPQPLLYAFCENLQRALVDAPPQVAAAVPVVKCERGLDATIRLVVESGGKRIVAGKRINLWLEQELENNNPRIDVIQIRPATEADAQFLRGKNISWVSSASNPDDWWVEVPEDPLPIYANVGYEVRSLIDPLSIDIWTPPAPDGAERDYLDPEKEVIVYRWMTTLGDIGDSERLYKEDLSTLDAASITEFSVEGCPDNLSVCELTLWSIARDGRLGIDWLERKLSVVGAR